MPKRYPIRSLKDLEAFVLAEVKKVGAEEELKALRALFRAAKKKRKAKR